MKTLVVAPNWMGDVLFLTAALRALRRSGDNVVCMVPERCALLLERNPNVDEVIVADDRDTPAAWFSAPRLLRILRAKRFDRAIFFHRSASKKFLAYLAGIPKRVGFSLGSGKDFFLTEAITPPPAGTHRADFFLELLKSQDIAAVGRAPDFFPAEKALNGELSAPQPYAVIHPGGNWDLKRWPAKHFAAFTRLFLEKQPDWTFVVCGTPGETGLAQEVVRLAGSPRVKSFCGKTTLDELAILLRGARFFLSNDSGPIHLAASQKTPTVGLFGPTAAAVTGPISEGPVLIVSQDVGCQVPCYFRACDDHLCMEWLSPQEVFHKTEAWLTSVHDTQR